MTGREWQPGDVVTGLLDGNEIVGIVGGGGRRVFYADSVTIAGLVDLIYVRDIRPLVVIDPEDDARVSALWNLLPGHLVSIDQLQDALREFANPTPPKPTEPLGLGAVVEDAEGRPWIRWSRGTGCVWRCATPAAFDAREWSKINAVRVLSEGVTQ